MGDFLHSFFDLNEMLKVFPMLLTEGLRNTLSIAALSLLLGLAIGLVLAVLLIAPKWWIRLPARIYVDMFRGLPAIVTVSIVGIGLPSAGIRPFGQSPFGYAVLAVGLITAAYIAEIFRSGIQSIPVGQTEAGRSLGLGYISTLTLVVIPQGIRNVLPALAGQFIHAIKESALVYLLGLTLGEREIYFIAQQQQANTYNSSAFVAAAITYMLITVPMTYAVNWLDRRLREGKRVTVPPIDLDDPTTPASGTPVVSPQRVEVNA